jgi:hypothetical protein
MKKNIVHRYFNLYSETATLAFFRLAFGFMMFLSLVRFASYNWIEEFYIKPQFHFTYFGFSWVKPMGIYIYLLFIIAGISALFVAIGYKYRMAISTFFLSFTYIELIDKTTYLNHYYFVSVISFVLIFLPANASFSLDAVKNPKLSFQKIQQWNIDILKILLGMVYFYAGLAKINSDWLLQAMPLKIWLPNNLDLPLIGSLLNENWVHYAFSWTGMIYDLSIPFLLLYKRTRIFAFVLVVVFHILTRILFPIGVFPYIMIVSSLVFFEAGFHKKCLNFVSKLVSINPIIFENGKSKKDSNTLSNKLRLIVISVFILFQMVFPFRYLLYKNELFWTEEGFRFSWRVMLMEKAGYTQFIVKDRTNNKEIRVNNSHFLTVFQEKQMSFQPDFILEYAHYLCNYYKKQGIQNPEVYVESYVALNGRLSQKFIDPTVNLANEYESFRAKTWILPFNDEIIGF